MSAYGYDSRRRDKERRARYWAAAWRQFRVSVICTALALIVAIIAYDHLAHPGNLTPPVFGHPIEVTSTLSPHSVTSHGHP